MECKNENGCNTGCSMTDKMMNITEDAWEELMREKMKAILQKHNGERMDRVAKAAVESANAHWENFMRSEMSKKESIQKITGAFRK